VESQNPAGEPGPGYSTGQPGYPSQPGYPGQPGSFPPAPPAPPAKRTNGWAIASLIFGIIGGIPLGLIFGIVGLVKSGAYRSGKVLSIIGIVLSLAWIAPVAYVTPHIIKASDPGCVAAEANVKQINDKLTADQNNPEAFVADVQNMIKQLTDAAAKSKNAKARDAMTRTAADFQELLDGVRAGKAPSADLSARVEADGNAVDKECGKF
jgi:hypothetical protein